MKNNYMRKTLRLNEDQLTTLIAKIVNEQLGGNDYDGGELQRFADDYISNINHGFYRMAFSRALETGDYEGYLKKVTDKPYEFTDSEKEKLNQLKPLFDRLANTVARIDQIIGFKSSSF